MTITPSKEFQAGLDDTSRIPMYIAKVLAADWDAAVVWQDTDRVVWYDTDRVVWYDPDDATGVVVHSRKSSALTGVNPWMKTPSSLSQQIYPEEGRSTISTVSIPIIDHNNFFTEMISLDPAAYLQNRKVELYAGYVDMAIDDFLLAFTGRVKDYPEQSSGVYNLNLYDPQKRMQREIFRDASEENPQYFFGNPMNLLLAWMTSTGGGLNGKYDWFDVHNGLGIDISDVNVSQIEKIRDDFFPGDSHNLYYIATEPIVAKSFFEEQIYKMLNLYPTVSGGGEFGLSIYKPPLPIIGDMISFVEADGDFIGRPKWSPHLQSLINEVSFKWDSEDGNFLSKRRFINGASALFRAEGKKTLNIESETLKSGVNRFASDIVSRKVRVVFSRYANPPNKITLVSPFRKLVAEAGNTVTLTHSLIPDLVNGTRGITAKRMEVIKKTLNAGAGNTSFEVLDTGFAKGEYQAIAPSMTITSGLSSTSFTVSEEDALKFTGLVSPEISVKNQFMLDKVTNVTIISMTPDSSGVYTVVVDDMGLTPSAGWIVVFANYDDGSTEEQKQWGFIADLNNFLGAANDAAHLIVP